MGLSHTPSVGLCVCAVGELWKNGRLDLDVVIRVVSGVGREMGVCPLDGVEIAQGEGAIFGMNVGRPFVGSEDCGIVM